MKIETLLKDITGYQIIGSTEVDLTGICDNSKQITPGNLFVAKKGNSQDGMQFIAEAVQRGASAILTSVLDPSLKHVTQIFHPNPASLESDLAASYYRHPSDELFMVGITGTNGKTTTSYIIKNLLDRIKGPCGLIGTIEYNVGTQRYPATLTTPQAILNQKMLREMSNNGCRSAVMEASSHALDQQRVKNIAYDAAIFTNLTLDHLNYHRSMEEYCAAKNRLFRMLCRDNGKKTTPQWAIVNQDSPWKSKIIEGCSAHVLTYGIDTPSDLQASAIVLSQNGTRAVVTYQGKSEVCHWPLVGLFNVYNCLAAMAVALTQNHTLNEVAQLMALTPSVRGRLEPVKNALGLKIFVDYAHTDDALINALKTLKELKKAGRLIVVFGCGGDRDHSKRPKMAQACEQNADFCILTSDNPRSENPETICEDAVKGFSCKDCYSVEVDRRAAIQKAIEIATKEDIILIAGKGHETTQIFSSEIVVFDDCQVAAEICDHLSSPQLYPKGY